MTESLARSSRDERAAGRWLALALLAGALVFSMTTWLIPSAVVTQLWRVEAKTFFGPSVYVSLAARKPS